MGVSFYAKAFPEFGVFEKDVIAAEDGDDQAGEAVEQAEAEDVHAEEFPGRVEEDVEERVGFAGTEHFVGGEGGEFVYDAEVVGDVSVGVVEDVVAELSDGAFDGHGFVDGVRFPVAFASAREACFAVGIPAAVFDPAAEVEGAAGDGEACVGDVVAGEEGADFPREFGRESLVRVEVEHPVAGCL